MKRDSDHDKRRTIGLGIVIGAIGVIIVSGLMKDLLTKPEVKEFTAFFTVSGTPVNDDNVIKERIAGIIGAKCNEVWLTGETAEQAVTRMIAGEEYPDFVNADQELYQAGALIPIDEYWEDYLNIRNFLPDSSWESIRQEDGHIYWIPQFGITNGDSVGNVHSDEAFWMQTRVLKWAGYPTVETLDEYFVLLENYIRANPVMSDGTPNVAYTILCDDWRYFCLENPPQFLDGYPNDGSVIVDPDTLEVIDYNTTSTAKRYFKKLNEEFHKGIVDPESFTQSYEEYIAKLSSGCVLGMVDQWWQFAFSVKDFLGKPELEKQGCSYVSLPITIDKGIKNKWHTTGGNLLSTSEGLAVTTGCQDVKGAFQFINDLLSQEVQTLRYWGIEGVDYEVDENGVFYRTPGQRKAASDPSYQTTHMCSYPYFPHHDGLNPDGINTFMPDIQPGEFMESVPADVRDCFAAYGCTNYVEMIGANDPPGPWFPMYTYSDRLTMASREGEVRDKLTKLKQRMLPKVVMSDDFDGTWEKYMELYQACRPEVLLDQMQKEVERRVEIAETLK